MESIVIFGKGGVGKTMIATSVSYSLAKLGMKVIHIGCDPKADSALRLTGGGRVPTMVEQYLIHYEDLRREHVITRCARGIDCIEAGGPEPGVGCGGRGISLMLQLFDDLGIFRDGNYDAAMFDVLGDIVCGGFAAPLRKGFARKVFIVVSEEVMSLYAANNIAHAVRTYARNGAALGGLILNLRDNGADIAPVEKFAAIIKTSIVQVINRDPLIAESEFEYKTVIERSPRSKSAALFKSLTEKMLEFQPGAAVLPAPMEQGLFHEFIRSNFGAGERRH